MKFFSKKPWPLCSVVLTLYYTGLFADENTLWIERIDNLRLAFDLSIGAQYNFNNDHFSHLETIGFDLHKVFTTSNRGDIGTLILQGYLTKLNNVEHHPPFFNGENDLKFICRICNFNLVILDRGALNFRIGHTEIPFGLEHNLDTNGTLRQYSNAQNLGTKLDWAIAINGKLSWGGYELSLGRGVGVDWTDDYHSYIVSGRIETRDEYSSFLGFSVFFGHLKEKNNSPEYIDRSRIGVDASTQMGPLTFLGEFSMGKDNNTELLNALLEADIHNNNEKLLGFIQVKSVSRRPEFNEWDTSLQTSLGMRYTPNNDWTLSVQWTHDIEVYQATQPTSLLEAQLRYRF